MDIILIEDNDADAELIARALRKYNIDNEIVRITDGEEALEFLLPATPHPDPRKNSPQLILLDLNLPKIPGLEVLKRLRADPRTRSLPIVMLTGSTDERDRADSDALGVNMYLVKPVATDAIAHMVSYAEMYWDLNG
jgi:two-component system response regulator